MADPAELHIASLIVHRAPKDAARVREAIAALEGAEPHLEEGTRLIVTVEGPDERTVGRLMSAVHMLDGVMSAVMVFQHSGPVDDTGPTEQGVESHAV